MFFIYERDLKNVLHIRERFKECSSYYRARDLKNVLHI